MLVVFWLALTPLSLIRILCADTSVIYRSSPKNLLFHHHLLCISSFFLPPYAYRREKKRKACVCCLFVVLHYEVDDDHLLEVLDQNEIEWWLRCVHTQFSFLDLSFTLDPSLHCFQINMSQPIYDPRQGKSPSSDRSTFRRRSFFLGGFRVFIGNLGARTNISELQHECERYGPLVDCWVAR